VAFCTQNIVPGIDFTNDPLLQGRNFSYLDTQLKRLGGPNFAHLPVNAPKCPFRTLQQDGHMALVNPKGRANYEPNSWPGEMGGPRESSDRGFMSHQADEQGQKIRIRAEAFADHYSQARQFYISQTSTEQKHIAAAFIFELSKVENVAIRARMVSHLLNVHDELADRVSKGLRLQSKPEAAIPARQPRTDLMESPALSILRNGPKSFHGRKIGALITDGVNAELIAALRAAFEEEGALIEFVAPAIGGVEANDGTWIEAGQKIDGGPSVLYDAVALLISEAGAKMLVEDGAARDFISDAYMHAKFIGYVPAAASVLQRAIGNVPRDDGFIELDDSKKMAAFVQACRQLRHWGREDKLNP
jgi:catalase